MLHPMVANLVFFRFIKCVHEPLYWHFVDVVWVVIFPTVYLWSLAGPVH